MNENVEKYLPWVIGAGVLAVGVYLFKNGVGNSSGVGYTTVAAPDNTAQVNAALQVQESQLQAGISGFNSIVGYINNKTQADYALKMQVDANAALNQQKQIEAQTQVATANIAAKAAKHHDKTQAIAGIASTIGSIVLLAAFCWEETSARLQTYVEYKHGVVGW